MATRVLALVLVATGAFLVGGRLAAAGDAWKVFFNGKPSTTSVVECGKEHALPVAFPLEQGEVVYEVRVRTDNAGHAVHVTRKKVDGPRQREGQACRFCSGSGKCNNDYPTGSGNTTSGQSCSLCNGTGTCNWCGGSGKT